MNLIINLEFVQNFPIFSPIHQMHLRCITKKCIINPNSDIHVISTGNHPIGIMAQKQECNQLNLKGFIGF